MKNIREIEQNILDNEYKKHKILKRSCNTAISHLLKVFGDLFRDIINDEENHLSYCQRIYSIGFLADGLAWCVKWITIDDNEFEQDIIISEEIDKEAIEFLMWGFNYAKLVNEHVALNKGLSNGIIDLKNKIIEFIPKQQNPDMCIEQFEFDKLYLERLKKLLPFEELMNNFLDWYKEFKFSFEAIQLPWEKVKALAVYEQIVIWMRDEFFYDLRKEICFGIYNIDDFINVYAILLINFIYYTEFEDYIDHKLGLENYLGSAIISMREEEFTMWLSELSGIEHEKVSEIVSDLTIDVHKFHSKLVFQPFICHKNLIYVSPRLCTSIDPRRMFYGAINSVKKPIYDSIVKSIEEFNLEEIEKYFTLLNCEVYIDKKVSRMKKAITPDILLVDRGNSIYIVGDYKHFLRPLGILDVSNKSGEVLKANKQINEYYNFVKDENFMIGDKNFDFSNFKGYKLLLFQFPMPLPLKDNKDMMIWDWTNMQEKIMQNGISSIIDLINYKEKYVDSTLNCIEKHVYESEDIHVGEWTYKRYMYVSKNLK